MWNGPAKGWPAACSSSRWTAGRQWLKSIKNICVRSVRMRRWTSVWRRFYGSKSGNNQKKDIRDHFASGCRQDDTDGEVPSLRRSHQSGRLRQGQGNCPSCGFRLDGDREAERNLRYVLRPAVQLRRLLHQHPGYAGTSGLLGRHLPYADGGGFSRDGHRRRQGRRGTDEKAL